MFKNIITIMILGLSFILSNIYYDIHEKYEYKAHSIQNFWFEIQDYFFKFDKNGSLKPNYDVYQTCSKIKEWEIDYFRQQANSVALSISDRDKEIAKAKVKCWLLNPVNKLLNFIFLMIFLHALFIFVLKLSNIDKLADSEGQNYWSSSTPMTKKQFFKKYFLIIFVFFWLTSGLFAAFMIPIEVIFHTIFNNGTFIFKELFNGFIDILKNAW